MTELEGRENNKDKKERGEEERKHKGTGRGAEGAKGNVHAYADQVLVP